MKLRAALISAAAVVASVAAAGMAYASIPGGSFRQTERGRA